MLNACAPGIGVVNIDNGYGAAVLASRIARRSTNPQKKKGARLPARPLGCGFGLPVTWPAVPLLA